MSAATATAGPADQAGDTVNRGAVTVCVMLATIMQALDTTIANVALPYMQGSLSASQDQINWVLTSYIVAAAIMTPPTGWLAARFGRKRLFVAAVVGFTIASVLCGIATSLNQMVLFRLLQGVFGASLVPLSQAVLLDIYPKERQGQAMAIWGVGVMVGPILGPTLGGWLTQNYSWPWVFFINVPVGILTCVGLLTFLSETRADRTSRLDWFGFGMLSLAIGALQLMLDRGEQLGWFGSREIIIETAISALAFYLFLVHTLTAERPFVNPKLFLDRNFTTGLIFIFLVGIILLATLALLTPYLQNVMGYPVLTAGMALAPRGMGTMLTMFLAGQLLSRIDGRLMIAFGLVLSAVALYEMMGFTPDVSQWTVVRSGFLQGAGLGFIFVPLTTITFATLPPAARTEGTALFSLMRNIGSSIGISYVISFLSSATQFNHSEIVAHITPYNQALHQPGLQEYWNTTTLSGRAMLDAVVTQQATIIAYSADFKLMMWIALISIPLCLVLRRPRRSSTQEPHVAVID